MQVLIVKSSAENASISAITLEDWNNRADIRSELLELSYFGELNILYSNEKKQPADEAEMMEMLLEAHQIFTDEIIVPLQPEHGDSMTEDFNGLSAVKVLNAESEILLEKLNEILENPMDDLRFNSILEAYSHYNSIALKKL